MFSDNNPVSELVKKKREDWKHGLFHSLTGVTLGDSSRLYPLRKYATKFSKIFLDKSPSCKNWRYSFFLYTKSRKFCSTITYKRIQKCPKRLSRETCSGATSLSNLPFGSLYQKLLQLTQSLQVRSNKSLQVLVSLPSAPFCCILYLDVLPVRLQNRSFRGRTSQRVRPQ